MTLLLVKRFIIIMLSISLFSCVKVPSGVKAIQGFKLEKYLGQWYEVARFNHSFEKGLTNVTANYSMNSDGSVSVLNRGFEPKSKTWKQAVGKAKLASDSKTGMLKVSFFGPFYGAYNIIELDSINYSYALVCSYNKSYLWILARNPELDKPTTNRLVEKAKSLGFNTEKLIFVEHDIKK